MVRRGWWLGLVLVAGACAQEEPAVAPPQVVEAEPAAEPSVRPVLEVLPDGSMVTKRVPVWLEPSVEERVSELTLSASDRALLEEFAAIQALYAQNSSAAVLPTQPAEDPEAALFGLETRDQRLWLLGDDEGARYRVTTKTGAVLAESIDAATLERDFPELHALLHEPLIDVIDY
jgi:hypothetical protein